MVASQDLSRSCALMVLNARKGETLEGRNRMPSDEFLKGYAAGWLAASEALSHALGNMKSGNGVRRGRPPMALATGSDGPKVVRRRRRGRPRKVAATPGQPKRRGRPPKSAST